MFALSPFGGSFVNLRPPYRTGTGKAELGLDVSHKRYSGEIVSGF
jgi:hypothetical protein